MNVPLLSPPACIALGLSLTLHVVLGGFGWGALSPDTSVRKEGIPLPAYAVQVRLVAPVSMPAESRAVLNNGDPDVVAAAAARRTAMFRGLERTPSARAAAMAQQNTVQPASSAGRLDRNSSVSAGSSAFATAPARDAAIDRQASSAVAAAQDAEGNVVPEADDAPSETALAAQGPVPPPDAVRLLTPPPVAPELTGAERAPVSPRQALLDATYYPTRQLSVRPSPTTEPTLTLPPNWFEAFGRTILTIYVNADGSVQEVVLRDTNLPPELHENVVDAFRRLSFNPGEIDGRRVPSFMSIEANVSMLLSQRNMGGNSSLIRN